MLEVKGLRKSFGALRASDGIDFHVAEGETHALIGPNGAGKTTFINQLAGTLRPDAGTIRFAGEDITRLPAPCRARGPSALGAQLPFLARRAPRSCAHRAGAPGARRSRPRGKNARPCRQSRARRAAL